MVAEVWTAEGVIAIPLLGSVAAGQPLEMFSVEETLDVPESLWHGRKVFALRVRGRSMIDAGIHDGDYLIVEPAPAADNGRTVVAEIDGGVTVKKLYRGPDGRVRLQPANPDMLPLIVPGDRVRVLGVVVGILRKYGFGAPPRPLEAVPRPAARRSAVPRAGTHPARNAARDEATLDIALNAIDAQLERWRAAIEQARTGKAGADVIRMAELGRDLQALREWCGRTSKPRLRRALLGEATKVMERMRRLAARAAVALPELPMR